MRITMYYCAYRHITTRKTDYGYGLLILHKEDERAELKTEVLKKLKLEENLVLVVIIKNGEGCRLGSACSK